MVPNKVVKAKVKLPVDRKTKQDKELEAGMVSALEKEDFYGKKKLEERAKKDAKEAINKRIVEESMKVKPKGVIFRSVEIKKKP